MLPRDCFGVAQIRHDELVSTTHPACSDGPFGVGRWPRLAFGRPSFDALRSWLKLLIRSTRQPAVRDSVV